MLMLNLPDFLCHIVQENQSVKVCTTYRGWAGISTKTIFGSYKTITTVIYFYIFLLPFPRIREGGERDWSLWLQLPFPKFLKSSSRSSFDSSIFGSSPSDSEKIDHRGLLSLHFMASDTLLLPSNLQITWSTRYWPKSINFLKYSLIGSEFDIFDWR